jgi:hypothetical protein
MLSLPRYKSGDKELMVLPQYTNLTVTKSMFIELHGLINKVSSWRMALAGEPSFELFRHSTGTVLAWFSILIYSMQVKRKE